jgi:hypothetical protein
MYCSKKMIVCFTQALRNYETPGNKMVACFTGGKYCHVTIIFEIPQPNGSVSYEECSILRGKGDISVVHLSPVENMEGWTCFKVWSDPKIESEVYEYVKERLLGTPYDNIGSVTDFALYPLFFCCFGCKDKTPISENRTKTYCSRLTLRILHKAGIFLGHKSERVTPNDLYNMIVNSKDPSTKWTLLPDDSTKIFSGHMICVPVNCNEENTPTTLTMYF